MNIPLSLKKRILSIVVGLIITGNIIRILSPSQVVVFEDLADPLPAFAGESYNYDQSGLLVPDYDFSYEESNYQSIQAKITYLDVDRNKVERIERYLSRRGSPMASEARTFVKMADKYGLPYNLMPAISIIESGGGKHNYRPYNYAGMGGQGNAMVFANYEQAIEKHAQIIRNGYFNKGANTPEKMERYYCMNCPTWGEKVQGVMNAIAGS